MPETTPEKRTRQSDGKRPVSQARRYTLHPVKSTLEALEGNKVKLSIEVDESEFDRNLDAAFRKIAHEVRLPGFRPGKAPRRVLEARIGIDAARGQALQDAIPEYLSKAVREHDVDIISTPDVIREALLSVRQRRLHLRLRHPVRIRMEPILPAGGHGVIELVTLLRKHRLLLHLEVFQPVLSLLLLLQCEAFGGLGGLRA